MNNGARREAYDDLNCEEILNEKKERPKWMDALIPIFEAMSESIKQAEEADPVDWELEDADGYEGDGEQGYRVTPNRKHYRVTIRLLDRSGFVPTRRLMERLNIPPAIDVQCGLTNTQLYDTIVNIAIKWLDFISDQFKLARIPRNRLGA